MEIGQQSSMEWCIRNLDRSKSQHLNICSKYEFSNFHLFQADSEYIIEFSTFLTDIHE